MFDQHSLLLRRVPSIVVLINSGLLATWLIHSLSILISGTVRSRHRRDRSTASLAALSYRRRWDRVHSEISRSATAEIWHPWSQILANTTGHAWDRSDSDQHGMWRMTILRHSSIQVNESITSSSSTVWIFATFNVIKFWLPCIYQCTVQKWPWIEIGQWNRSSISFDAYLQQNFSQRQAKRHSDANRSKPQIVPISGHWFVIAERWKSFLNRIRHENRQQQSTPIRLFRSRGTLLKVLSLLFPSTPFLLVYWYGEEGHTRTFCCCRRCCLNN